MLTIRQILLFNRLKEARRLSDIWLTTTEDELTEIQLSLLRKRWQEATKNVPYYQQLVASGDAPKDFSSLAEYTSSIPIFTKEILCKNQSLFRRKESPANTLMTAGSTGEPLRFGIWKNELVNHTGIPQWTGRFHNGMGIQDRVFLLWGHSHLLGTGIRGRVQGFLRRLKDSSMNYLRVDAYHIDPDISKKYHTEMISFRPKVVIGYSCTLDLWARQCLANGLSTKNLNLKLCICCSENFPHPDSREVLQKFLGCPVIMEYGGVDFGVCAYEVLQQSKKYCTFWWSHFLEKDPGKKNRQFLVTNLTNRYLPLFRYANGDECEGEETLNSGHIRSFKRVKGRVNDFLEMPDGRSIHSVGLFHCIHQEPEVWSIQLIKSAAKFRIKLAGNDLPRSSENRIRNRLGDLHPYLKNVPIEVEKDVLTNRAGKRRWIVQEQKP